MLGLNLAALGIGCHTDKDSRHNGGQRIVLDAKPQVMTIIVQSSSITTSTLVPLVALGIITVEQMLPLTLGANIGTTCTAFLASIVTEKKNAIQIALVHLFFNIIGICIWFPLPFMRNVPLKIAKILGDHTVSYRWFGAFYILLIFVLIPLLLFAFSFTISLGAGGIFINIILDLLVLAGVIVLIWKFDLVMSRLGLKPAEASPLEESESPQEATNENGVAPTTPEKAAV